MKVRETATGKMLEVNASYGARLCEQGKAIPVPKEPETASVADSRKGSKKAVAENGTD